MQLLPLPVNSRAIGLLVPPETTVAAGLPILLAQYTGFALQGTIPKEKIYRFSNGIISAKGEITNGPGPFDAKVLGTPFMPETNSYFEPLTLPQSEVTTTVSETASLENMPTPKAETNNQAPPINTPNTAEGIVVVAAIPSGLKLITGMPGLLALKIAEVENAVAIPLEAVAGSSQRGQVFVKDKDRKVLREVTLGISDGSYIQITSGLRQGEEVVLPSPSIVNLK